MGAGKGAGAGSWEGRAKGRPTLWTLWSLLLGFQSVGRVPGNAGVRPPAAGLAGKVGSGGSPGLWGLPHSAHLTPGRGGGEQFPPSCVFYT